MRSLLAAALVPCALAAADEVFIRDVQPILVQRCYGCHAGARTMGGVRFDRKAEAFSKADSGSIPILPGDPERSEMLRRIKAADPSKRMPLGQKALADSEAAILEKWIRGGAPWPEETAEVQKPHWAFQPLQRPAPPAVRLKTWVRNPIDAFIL